MASIVTYPSPLKLLVVVPFSHEYIGYDHSGGHSIGKCYVRDFSSGELVTVIAKVSSEFCSTGYGYIVWDEEFNITFIADLSLFNDNAILLN